MQDIWQSVLDNIAVSVQEHVFEAWFKPTRQKCYEGGVLTVFVPNSFHKERLNCAEHKALIENSLREVTGEKPTVRFELYREVEGRGNAPSVGRFTPSETSVNSLHHRLNPSYTFKNFVVGASNQFAHAASTAVSESPAKAYNPLFIYGAVGLGKTHLMHAIGHNVLQKSASMKAIYLTSEGFVNDLISSLQHDRMEGFRNKYRSIDVLLIDDIQFIGGKDRTQEEFFHTFNTLYESSKQIVISSDRFPKDIAGLEERLRSRFEWGLIADIQPPDLETKMAILNSKAEKLHVDLPSDVSYYIASRIKTNVRELEGCLLRLSALSDLTGSPIQLEMAKKSLAEVLHSDNNPPSIERIQKLVAEHFKTNMADLKSRKRNKSIVLPRQIAMYLIRKHTGASLPETGRAFGDKDHSTVLHSYRKIDSLLQKGDNQTTESIRVILNKLDL